jgi:hypothetical protein
LNFELVTRLGAAPEGERIDACPEPFLRQDKLRRRDGFNEEDNIKPEEKEPTNKFYG